MNKENRILHDTAILTISYIIAFAINFFIPIIVVRYLAKDDFGIYKQLFLIFYTLVNILLLGMPASLYYFIPKATNEERKYYVSQLQIFLFCVGLASLSILMLSGYFLKTSSHLFHLKPFFLLMGTYILMMMFTNTFEDLLIINNKVRIAGFVIVISDVLKAFAIIISVVLTGSLLVVLKLLILVALLRSVFLVLYLYKYLDFSVRDVKWKYLYPQLAFSIPFGISGIIGIISTKLPDYFISYLYNAATYAIYAVGCFQIPLLPLFVHSISTILIRDITKLRTEGDTKEIVGLWNSFQLKVAMISIPCYFFLSIMAKEVITVLFTANFLESVPVFLIMVLNIPLSSLITQVIFRSFGETRFLVKVNLISLVVNIIIIWPLGKVFGLPGIALSSIIAVVVRNVLEIYKVKNILKTKYYDLMDWNKLGMVALFSIISCIIIYSLKSFLGEEGKFILVVMFLAFFGVYSILLWKSNVLSHDEKNMLKRYLSNKIRAMAVK